jgi:hypothetical protein
MQNRSIHGNFRQAMSRAITYFAGRARCDLSLEQADVFEPRDGR